MTADEMKTWLWKYLRDNGADLRRLSQDHIVAVNEAIEDMAYEAYQDGRRESEE